MKKLNQTNPKKLELKKTSVARLSLSNFDMVKIRGGNIYENTLQTTSLIEGELCTSRPPTSQTR